MLAMLAMLERCVPSLQVRHGGFPSLLAAETPLIPAPDSPQAPTRESTCKEMSCLHPLPAGVPESSCYVPPPPFPALLPRLRKLAANYQQIHPVPFRLREVRSPKPGRPLKEV